MKKSLLFLIVFSTLSLLANAQISQFYIGDSTNQTATNIKYLNDGTIIIAGYNYDVNAGTVTNADMFLMKVSSTGSIIWQKKWGTVNDDIVQDLIITRNGDVVVVGLVGRTGVYANNIAAIYRFDSSGSLLWQKYVQDQANTPGGELFWAVTELQNNQLVAVGAHNHTPSGSGGLVSVFNANGTIQYNEYIDLPSGDAFYAVCSKGDTAFIAGMFVNNYKDIRIVSYTPSISSGIINWERDYDILQNTYLNNNFAESIHFINDTLLINGSSLDGYSYTGGLKEFIMKIDKNGNSPTVKSIANSGLDYSNNTAIFPFSSDVIYTVQNPYSAYYDITILTSNTNSNCVVSKLSSFNNSSIAYTKGFNLAGAHSILDLVGYDSSYLLMAGCAHDSANATTYGGVDIYLNVSNLSMENIPSECGLNDQQIAVDSVYLTNVFANPTTTSFQVNNVNNLTILEANYNSRMVCGTAINLPPIIPPTEVGIKNQSYTADVLEQNIPNPFTAETEINFVINNQFKLGYISVYDLFGRELRRFQLTSKGKGNIRFSNEGFAPGTYFYSLVIDGKTVATKRMILAPSF